VAVVPHLPLWLSLRSYGVVAEPPVFLRSLSCKCSHRACLFPVEGWPSDHPRTPTIRL